MSLKLIGKKLGMTQVFDKNGKLIACTAIHIAPNLITSVKGEEKDGYKAVQVGVPHKKKKNLNKPQVAAFDKKNLPACSLLAEFRVSNLESYQIGAKLGLEQIADEEFVDLTSVSKGKGYQGAMKKYGFRGGPASHGSGFHRHAGSTGMRSTPGRCLPGGKRASQMGGDKVTVQNMRVIEMDAEKGILFVKGAVPGAKNDIVYVRKAVKKGKR